MTAEIATPEIMQKPLVLLSESVEMKQPHVNDLEGHGDYESSQQDYLLSDAYEDSPGIDEADWKVDTLQSSDLPEGEITSCKNKPVRVRKKRVYKKRPKNHICLTCGSGFESPFTLQEHNRMHTGERPFLCSICGQSFRHLASLTKHQQRHNGTGGKTCPICQKTVLAGGMKMHMNIHNGVKPNICQECGKAFVEPKALRRHSLVHTGERPFMCTQCGKRFNQKGNLKTHLKTHSNITPFVCSICGKGFKHSFTHRNHMAKHSEVTVDHSPINDLCDLSESKEESTDSPDEDNRDALCMDTKNVSYINTETINQFKVEINQEAQNPQTVAAEIAQCNVEVKSPEGCESSTQDYDNLLPDTDEDIQDIADSDSPNNANRVVMSVMCMETTNISHLNSDTTNQFKVEINQEPQDSQTESGEITQSNVEDEAAEDCESIVQDSDNLLTESDEDIQDLNDLDSKIDCLQSSDSSVKDEITSGKRDQRDKDQKENTYEKKPRNKKRNICPTCGFSFASHFKLQEHIRVHTGERPFLCSICGKSFRVSLSFTRHMKKHNRTECKTCPICQKTLRGNGMSRHMKIHTGVKQNICQECGKAFLEPKALRRHSLVHTGELPFKCTQCGKGFNQNSNLKTHLRTHTNQTPYVCSVCGKGFKHSFTRRNHLAKHSEEDKVKNQ